MDGIKHYLTDMDGVIVRGSKLLPGAVEFVQRLRTILVLSGVTTREQAERFPYRPTWIRESIADVEI